MPVISRSSPAFRIALAGVAAAAFALRLAGIDWGEPYDYHFDEPFIVKPALRMAASGDPNPHFFRYPPLLIYIETAIVAANHRVRGMPLDVPEGPSYGPSDLGTWTWPAVAGGRLAVALFGTLAVVAAGAMAMASGGTCAGIAAALLLALFPLHVEHSHYLTTDVPSATFLSLAFLGVWVLRGSRVAAACAGIAMGLAVATKYTAAAALPALGLLLVLRGSASARTRAADLAIMAGTCALVFLAICPFVVLDSGTFLSELNLVGVHYSGGHLGAEGVANWGWYLRRLQEDGLGSTGLALLAIGALAVVHDLFRSCAGVRHEADRPRRSPAELPAHDPRDTTTQAGARRQGASYATVLLALAIAWFASLGAVPVRFERNLMPAVVLVCPAIGHGLGRLLDVLGRHGRLAMAAGWVALLLAMTGPALMSLGITRQLSSDDTRNQALRWIEDNVPPGSSIVREEYTPQPDPERYRVRYTWSLGATDLGTYRRAGADYLVVSHLVYARVMNDPLGRYPEMAEHYRRIFKLPRAAEFKRRLGTIGPSVTIYRIRRVGTGRSR